MAGPGPSPALRKHKTLTLIEKMEVLEKLDSGWSCGDVAKAYGVGRSTIFDIRKKREKIEKYVNTMNFYDKKCTMKNPSFPEIEEALASWWMEERFKINITSEMLRDKAIFFGHQLGKTNFLASGSWLEKFKKR